MKDQSGTRLLARLAHLDRRWLYLVLAIALVVTILIEPQLPEQPSLFLLPLYDRIEQLPPDAPILLSLDYGPGSEPELEPMALAVTRHALARGLPVVFMSLWPEGPSQIEHVVEQVIRAEFPGAIAGEDWGVLGYKAGGEMLINALVHEVAAMYPTDAAGRALSDLAVLAPVHSLADFALVVSFSGGTPGLKEWILFGGDLTGVPVAGGAKGVGSPEYLAYFPRQLLGLVAGLKGASEYEEALANGHPELGSFPRPASAGMGPQTVAHALILLFLVFGNLDIVVSWWRRRTGGDRS